MKFIYKYKLLKTNLWAVSSKFILNKIEDSISGGKNFLISPLASQTLVIAYFDKHLKKILDSYDFLFADSLWVKRAINFLHGIGLQNRLRGSNFMLNVCNYAETRKYKIFLYGTTEETLNKLKNKLLSNYPRLQIVGTAPSKFSQLTSLEKQELINMIEKSNTELLFTALGSPLEQIFSYELLYKKPKFKKNIIILPVGAAFDFISGVKPHAPKWMQDGGLEWFFRLLCEPRRLWKRYLVYGPIFVILVLVQKIKMSLNLPREADGEGKGRR